MRRTLTDMQIALWNRLVGSRWTYLYEDAKAFVFLHPTKGYRKVAKSRLGVPFARAMA